VNTLDMINMVETVLAEKRLAIVIFGPATVTTGLRPAEYFQVTIDPNTCSPTGNYIRFGLYAGDEIVGWQRVDAMTIVEDLGPSDAKMHEGITGYSEIEGSTVSMMKLE